MVVKLSGGDSYTHGAVAQLGEHLTCTEGVAGSSPVSSTILNKEVIYGKSCKK